MDFDDLLYNDNSLCDKSKLHSNIPFANEHTSSFVDIDGDCINDILILSEEEGKTRRLEIWRGIPQNNQIKYCLTSSSIYELDKTLGLFSLADVDRNGSLDIIFPILQSPPAIKVAYNKIPIHFEWTEDYCATHIKNSNNLIPLLFDDFYSTLNPYTLQTFLLSNNTNEIFYEDNLIKPIIRFGDIDMDSYADFIVTIYNKETLSRNVKIFYNHEKKFGNENLGIREYSPEFSYENPLLNNAVYASFFDLDEDGKLDVIITYKEDQNIFNTIGFFNTNIYDRYYLKSLFLKQRRVNFSNKIGASFRYICADLNGERRMDLATQATQLNQLMMNLPYAFIGVGRSNNYIENFCVINGNSANVIIFLLNFLA